MSIRMSGALSKFLKKLKEEAKSGRRMIRHGDPAIGLEYNKINGASRVTQKIWDIDLARTPQVVRGMHERVDVNGNAWKANKYNPMVHYLSTKVKGRGRF